jgi:type IV secretion system protein VirB11
VSVVEILDEGVYLSAYLRPFERWLAHEDVTEILVNRPGEVWIEAAGVEGMRAHAVPEVDDLLLERLAGQIARVTHQGVNRERPLLSATLPSGVRVQLVGPPPRHRADQRRHLQRQDDLPQRPPAGGLP